MLPKAHRLHERRDISRLLRMGRKTYGSLFSFSYAPNSFKQSRFTLVVGKKFFPRAVDRNRVKRLVRESLRQFLPIIAPKYDGVFLVAKKPTEKLSLTAVSADIKLILQKTHLLK